MEPVGGQSAFFKMYSSARAWSIDAQAMEMTPIKMESIPPKDGKFPAWKAQFVSPSKMRSKNFTFSITTADGLSEGIYSGNEEPYSGPRGQNSAFNPQALKIDSPDALKTALGKGADYVKKNPDKPITFILEQVKKFQNPTWRVLWGDSVSSSEFSVYVDASTGEYKLTMH